MTAQQILETVRAGDLETLGLDRDAVADAVQEFAAVRDAASALELVGRTWRIWFFRAELDEGSAVVAAALAIARGSAIPIWEARALYADGLFAFRSGDQQRSRASNEKALLIARQTGDVRGECDALTGLARVALRDGRYKDVVALALEGRDRAIAGGDLEAGASPLHLQAAGTRLQRDYLAARELYLESLRLNTELGNTSWVSMELHNLGWVELHLGNVEEAKARFHEREAAAAINAHDGAWTELNWAAIASAEGDVAEARRRFEIGTRALTELAVVLDPDDLAEVEWLKEQLRS
jgi:tetratricopeptide (TPR) repeat protein